MRSARCWPSLQEKKLDDNTLVFFISDNGGPTLPRTTVNGSHNNPLRGSKRTTLEGGIRVPFLVKWPGQLPAGKVYEQPVIQLDILPTALAAAGIDVRSRAKSKAWTCCRILPARMTSRRTMRCIGDSVRRWRFDRAIGSS